MANDLGWEFFVPSDDSEWISSGYARIGVKATGLTAQAINPILREVIGKKAKSITQYPELRKQIGNLYGEAVKPYVPLKSGDLRKNFFTTADGRIIWSSVAKNGYNYAALQYHEDKFHHNEGRSRWTEAVQPGTAEWPSFIEDVKRLVIEELNNE